MIEEIYQIDRLKLIQPFPWNTLNSPTLHQVRTGAKIPAPNEQSKFPTATA
jgi:hypothetical protein